MRVFSKLVFGMCMALTVAACGTKNHDDQEQKAPELSSEEIAALETEFALIPKAAIIRVPIDADGNATGEAEMRIVQNGNAPTNDDEMTQSWSTAEAPAALVSSESELDNDSSTQSWNSYGYGSSCDGASYGCGGGFGGGGFGGGGYNNYYQNQYRPTLYAGGNSWGYGAGYNCNRGGFAYYSYGSRRYW